MAFGFDPARFRVNLQQTPVWAAQGRVWAENVTAEQQQMLERQMPRISQEIGGALQWAMTDPAANAAFQFRQTYSEGVAGDYFEGRQYLEADPEREQIFFIETECCLTRPDVQNLPEIYERFNVLLLWDAVRTVGRLTLAEETDHQARLGLPDFRLVRTLSLQDVQRSVGMQSENLPGEVQERLTRRWDEICLCLQDAAHRILDDQVASGQMDDHFFPCRLNLSGGYCIHRVTHSEGIIGFMLHFLGQPRAFEDDHLEYLGYDVQIVLEEDQPATYELWGSSAI